MSNQAIGIVNEQLSRLENIQTRWSLLRDSGDSSSASIAEARNALVLRYAAPIRSYVQAMVRDEDVADELAQDALVRLLKGDFAGADPDRGRFRDLIKTAVRNMVRNHWKRNAVRKTSTLDPDMGEADEVGTDDPWVANWREHLLEMAWADLRQLEQSHPNRFPFSSLQVRIDAPDATSTELAERLSQRIGHTVKPDAYRQQLKRARDRFAQILVRELVDSLDEPTSERVHDEIIALGLYPWLKDQVDA